MSSPPEKAKPSQNRRPKIGFNQYFEENELGGVYNLYPFVSLTG
jgi:hypothetical protein